MKDSTNEKRSSNRVDDASARGCVVASRQGQGNTTGDNDAA